MIRHLLCDLMRLSKSKFVAGVQCLKRLYLQVHQPEFASELDEATRAVIKQGRQVGLIAQKAFPGGVSADGGPTGLDRAIQTTRELVAQSEAPAIFEATFQHENVVVRTDVLKRSGTSGHCLIEVKSATRVKPYYAYDIAIQRHVLAGAGVEVQQTRLMHLNRDYVFDGTEYDVSQLFVSAELEPDEVISESEISGRLKEQFHILDQPAAPDIGPGDHCNRPTLCEFYEHCNPALSADHVSLLPRIHANKVRQLIAAGITSIKQIPAEFSLSERQRRAVDCVKKGELYFGPDLAEDLDALKYPLCFMDFETASPALPRFAGMTPYDNIPFQWSVHRQEAPGGPLQHFEFLAEGDSDPRAAFMVSLKEAVAGAGNIVVYNESFEYSRLDDLARWLPEYGPDIEGIKTKIWDLLVAIRRDVYHPAFGGSFSLKSVLPAFVPEMAYESLEVSEGRAAGLAWERLIAPATPLVDKKRLRKALLEYCGQDTLALVKLVGELRKCAGL